MANEITKKTYEEILDEMCKRVTNCSSMEGSFIYTALAPFAMELASLYIQLYQDENNGFADTADFEHLLLLGKDRGLAPYTATKATGIGKFDKEIPMGSKFTINTYSWISGDQIEGILDGYFYYKMESEQTGSIVNTVIGKLTPITYIQGLEYSYLTEITIPARDNETIDAFRERYYATFNKKSFGGNKADYIDKINSINGVGGCKVYPLWNGGGTVKITVINSSFEVPSTTLIQDIQDEIDPEQDGHGDGYAPIGHTVTITGVTNKNITVGCKIVCDATHTFSGIKDDLIRAVNEYFLTLNKTWSANNYLTVRIAQVITVLLNVTGVIDVTECELNGDDTNLELSQNEIANLIDIIEINGR